MNIDLSAMTAIEVSSMYYDSAWNGNPPGNMLDFPSSCVFSYTAGATSDFAMHHVGVTETGILAPAVSDFPAYCPLTTHGVYEPGTTTSPWHDELLDHLPSGLFGTALKAYSRSRAQIEHMQLN